MPEEGVFMSPPQTDSQDPGPDPMVKAGILDIQAVTPFEEAGKDVKDVNWIESSTQFDRRWRGA